MSHIELVVTDLFLWEMTVVLLHQHHLLQCINLGGDVALLEGLFDLLGGGADSVVLDQQSATSLLSAARHRK